MTISLQVLTLPEGEVIARREHYVTQTPFTIGREYDCDLVLPDANGEISRKHIILERSDSGSYLATDLSTNGTKLNAEPIGKNAEATLSDGDILKICGYELLVGIAMDVRTNKPDQADEIDCETEFGFVRSSEDAGPLNPNAPTEVIDLGEPAGFNGVVKDLAGDLLFDPFAEGPKLSEGATATRNATESAPKVSKMPFNGAHLDRNSRVPPLQQLAPVPLPMDYRPSDITMRAVEHAMTRFLESIDPGTLEQDYRELAGFFGRSKKRYWNVHKRQFSTKTRNGEYVRAFKSLLAEELSKR